MLRQNPKTVGFSGLRLSGRGFYFGSIVIVAHTGTCILYQDSHSYSFLWLPAILLYPMPNLGQSHPTKPTCSICRCIHLRIAQYLFPFFFPLILLPLSLLPIYFNPAESRDPHKSKSYVFESTSSAHHKNTFFLAFPTHIYMNIP